LTKDKLENSLNYDIETGKEKDILPLLPVRDIVLFPGVVTPLFVGRVRSKKALEWALNNGDRRICIVTQKDMEIEEPTLDDLYEVGVLANVLQMVRLPDGTTKVLIEGTKRVYVKELVFSDDFYMCVYKNVKEEEHEKSDHWSLEPLKRSVLSQFEKYVSLHPRIPPEILMTVTDAEDPSQLADLVASHLMIKIKDRQNILETIDVKERMEKILKVLFREIELLQLELSIQEKVKQQLEKSQKEYYLREQLRVIQSELGQNEEFSEIEMLRKNVIEAKMSPEAQEKALHELERMSKMPPLSAEATVVRTYIDWLINMPWEKRTRDTVDIKLAQKVLDEDHYGLEKAKERILEFLAVRKKASGKIKSQVLCFVGPPGVGKTSLGRSIAKATGRRFVNMSLGGIRDEAEIRGHRRTYIGSLPGRIIQKVHQAGTKNPVILLDEIDKIGADFRGDPAAALLEVLDPEQNSTFTDHFLEVPFDLSNVMFITTANVVHTIPKPLLDRMEVIKLSGYVLEEKYQIAKKHLIPKVLKEHGLSNKELTILPTATKKIISDYTHEAGVRELERQLAKIARKVTKRIVEEQQKKSEVVAEKIGVKDLRRYLGVPRHYDAGLPKEPQIGAIVGLAWTQAGGDVLIIEAVTMKGKGNIILTGNLGEVMQESARAALSYLKAHSEELGINDVKWDELDIHIHVPEGAIPKDGPSAGVALATVIYSVASRRKIRNDIAITGETTLRGMVLPVGGIKEKILAARRYGMKEVILPEGNKIDVEEIPQWLIKGLKITFVSEVREAIIRCVSGN